MPKPLSEQLAERAVQYCLENPQWRLSLQTHKMIGVP
jgi:7-carboxy-7-deazaguanine synthase